MGKRIVAVALLLPDDTIVTRPRPARHHTLIHWLHRKGLEEGGYVQGFLTDEGFFVPRTTAKGIAIEAGQLNERGKARNYTNELYSEDVW